jgi:hypothetical protein
LEFGEQILSFHSSKRDEKGVYLNQRIQCVASINKLQWSFENFFDLTLILPIFEILGVVLLVSLGLLIASLLLTPQSKRNTTLAHSGFGLVAIVAMLFIIAVMMIVKPAIENELEFSQRLLTVFPSLTLLVAVLAMILLFMQPKNTSYLQNTNPVQSRQLLYLIPGGMLFFAHLGSLIDILALLYNHKNVITGYGLYIDLFLVFLIVGLLILVMFYAWRSKWKTVWYVIAVSFLIITRQYWLIVKRIEFAKQQNIEDSVPFWTYLLIGLSITLLTVALWDIFNKNKTKQ